MILIPHLETDLTVACQLSCVACNHMVPMWRDLGVWRADSKQVERDLNNLARVVHANAWAAIGGEPLLHRNIVEIQEIARKSGIADQIEVWTNGLLLDTMPVEFWRAVDVIVLSIYDGKHDDDSLARIRHKACHECVELVVKDERTWHNFRTNLEPVPTNAADTKRKFDGCFFRQFSRVANRGYFYTCCCAPHMPVLLQGRSHGSDGIAINEHLTEATLRAYLERSEPLGCCTICAGRDTAKPVAWREERDPVKWVEASKGLDVK